MCYKHPKRVLSFAWQHDHCLAHLVKGALGCLITHGAVDAAGTHVLTVGFTVWVLFTWVGPKPCFGRPRQDGNRG